MKKNTLNIIILTLGIINLVLNVLIIFSVIPTANKTNNLITKVAGIIDLELNEELGGEAEVLPIDKIDNRTLTNADGKNTITVSIPGNDGKNHYAVVTVVVSLNMQHEDYETLSASFDNATTLMASKVDAIVSEYSYETASSYKSEMQGKILQEFRTLFQSDMIYDVSLSFVLQ